MNLLAPPEEFAREAILPFDLYRDLLGKGFEDVGRCWGLVVDVCRRMGQHVSGAMDDLWEDSNAADPAPGDVVLLKLAEAGAEPHVAVYLGGGKILHALRGGPDSLGTVAVTPYGAVLRAGKVERAIRWAGRFKPPMVVPEPGDVTVILCRDVTRPFSREIYMAPYKAGGTVADYTPAGANVAVVNGRIETLEAAAGVQVGPGTVVVYGCFPGATALISLAIGLVLTLISTLFAPAIPKPSDSSEAGSPSFDLTGLHNTATVGIAQPIVYGEHRVAGNIIHAFQRADQDGRSVLFMAIMLSRGPIHSIGGLTADADDLTGINIPDTIQIDGNPARQYGVSVSVRLGGSNQEAMPGFNETISTITYARTMKPSTSATSHDDRFTHITTDAVTGFDLLINYPLGLYNIDLSSGGVVGHREVAFTIEYRIYQSVGPYSTIQAVHSGARHGPFTKQVTVRSLLKARYEIRIERYFTGVMMPASQFPSAPAPPWPETDPDKESRSDLVAVNEITSDSLTYPGKAMIGIRAIATDQLSGALPTVTATIKGRKVWIWDGVSETSPDFGTAETYTDSPPWCVLDMLLNPHYGMARNGKLTLNSIDLQSFYDWATLCATLVSDGRGGTVARAVCDLVVDQVQSGWEFIYGVALSHWGRLLIAGNEIRVVLEKAASPVALIGMGQAKDVVVSYDGRRQRPNSVEVQYLNEENNYEQDFAPKLDETAIFTNGEPVVKESLRGFGITRAAQAYRLAQFRMLFHKYAIRRLDCTVGPEFLHLLPGDVVGVQHDCNKPSTGQSGRILDATASTVKLDRAFTITSGTNKIAVRTSGTGADVLQERTLTNGTYAREAAISVTSNWAVGDVPVRGNPYVAGPSSTYYSTYRILGIETDPATLERKLSCVEYVAAIYSDDPGTVETFTDDMPDPRAMPDNVEDLTLSESPVFTSDGTAMDGVRVEWNPVEQWHGADVWYCYRNIAGGGEWNHHCRTSGTVALIAPVGSGSTIEVSVTATARQGTRVHPDYGAREILYVRGARTAPDPPTAIQADVVNSILYVKIAAPTDPTVGGYDVRYGSTWAGSMKIGSRVGTDFSTPVGFTGTQTVRVRSVSRMGVPSTSELTTSVTASVPTSVYTSSTIQTEHAAFGGTKVNTVVTASKLVLDGSVLTGTYAVPQILDSGTLRTMVTVTAGIQSVVPYIGECAFRIGSDRANVAIGSLYLNGFEIDEGLKIGDFTGVPIGGLVGSCMLISGPIDIVAALTPSVATSIDGGASRASDLAERSYATSLDATLTMRRPHSRYIPEVSAMSESLYDYTP